MSQMPWTGPPGTDPMTMGQNRPRPTPQYDQGRGIPSFTHSSQGGMNSTQMNRGGIGPSFGGFSQGQMKYPMTQNRMQGSMDRFGQPQQRSGGMFGGMFRGMMGGGLMGGMFGGGNGMNRSPMQGGGQIPPWMQTMNKPPMMNSGGQMGGFVDRSNPGPQQSQQGPRIGYPEENMRGGNPFGGVGGIGPSMPWMMPGMGGAGPQNADPRTGYYGGYKTPGGLNMPGNQPGMSYLT